MGILGIFTLLGIAYLLSNNRRKINYRLVIWGLTIQLIFALLILKSPFGKEVFSYIDTIVYRMISFSDAGSDFLFKSFIPGVGFHEGLINFAFRALPTIIFFSGLMAVFYHFGIIQFIVKWIAKLMQKTMGTSGSETLSISANIFVGQTEAPLMIRPFLKGMTNSELLTIMTGGMATIAGGVMAAYIQMLGSAFAEAYNMTIPEAQIMFATHLLGASLMAAPAALVISKIIYPETEVPETMGSVKVDIEKNASNVVEAAAGGAGEGLKLALNVGAMLLAFIALIALINYFLGWVGDFTGLNAMLLESYNTELSLQFIFGVVLQFLAFAIGVPWESAMQFGSLIGTNTVTG